jgi:hypothetical protein
MISVSRPYKPYKNSTKIKSKELWEGKRKRIELGVKFLEKLGFKMYKEKRKGEERREKRRELAM